MWIGRIGGVVLCLATLCCGGLNEPLDGEWGPVGDGWSELGQTSDNEDVLEAQDVVETDTMANDVAPEDTAPALEPDTAPELDTAPVDTGPADTGPVDTGPSNVCEAKRVAFEAEKSKALSCTEDFQCYAPFKQIPGEGFSFGTAKTIGCPCEQYYSDATTISQSLADLNAEYTKAGCKSECPKAPCLNLKMAVGVCQSGGCVTKQATCKEMESLVAEAVKQGRSCSQDSECSNFGMQGGLPCGCPVNVNLAKLAPGKPLFLYVTMVTRAYNEMGCSKGVACACEPVGKGACVNNVCVTK